ncbi:hypothetical protein G7085_00600 [Tessaracoccus sp. HDW20]|nr:hypothetical protein [Tessaracoccus coleopterorum]NHB83701.1 hypothetical protein [Tessaracoccus coleopterorum]
MPQLDADGRNLGDQTHGLPQLIGELDHPSFCLSSWYLPTRSSNSSRSSPAARAPRTSAITCPR